MLGVWDGFLQKSTKISHLPVPSLPVEPAARQRGAAASSNQRRGCGSAAAKERLSREALADGDFPMFFPILMVILDGDFGWWFLDFCRVLGTIHDIHDGEEQMVISHYRIVVCIVYEWLYFDVIRSGWYGITTITGWFIVRLWGFWTIDIQYQYCPVIIHQQSSKTKG